ncbi:thioredoxin-like protein [Polychytrium aggregatum]|uniref:thioredoxin-like protein n=1 Tax=Polychytrium aggregatum TaxID=110093 RepID=UPI0022FE2E4C|nr:thioredoxin-like protein [Polychytrium aggregatum]KAI9208317.1 thioredoxin-like protein [Polychytrium aggregatum]
MKLWSLLRLYLVSLLALGAAAELSVKEAYELAEKSVLFIEEVEFQDSISTGSWVVFFGTKWCPHCQKLTPKWLKMQQAVQEYAPNFNVRKVECTRNEAFCDGQNIQGYPTLKLFVDGKFVEELPDRAIVDEDTLIKYAKEKAIASKPKEDYVNKLKALALSQSSGSSVNPKGELVHLTQNTFPDASSSQPWFVMFHAPWCGHCKNLAPTWEVLARELKNKVNVGKVDCTVETGLQKKYKIAGFPTLKILQGSNEIGEYRGARTLDALRDYALKVFNKPVFAPILASDIATARSSHEISFFYVYNPVGASEESLHAFINVAKANRVDSHFYIVPDAAGFKSFNIADNSGPIIVASKDDGATFALYGDSLSDEGSLTQWVAKHKVPVVPEVTGANSQRILGGNNVVVMAIVHGSEQSQKQGVLKQIRLAATEFAEKSDATDVSFVWLDGEQFDSYILRVFKLKTHNLPALIIMDPKTELYYDTGADGERFELRSSAIVTAAVSVAKHDAALTPKYINSWFSTQMRRVGKVLSPLGIFVLRHPIVSIAVVISGILYFIYWVMKDDTPADYHTVKSE